MNQLLEEYARHLLASNRSPGTVKLRILYIEQLALEHRTLTAVTTEDLEAILARRRQTHAAETRKAMRASYRLFFAWLCTTGRIQGNPAEALDPIRVPVKVPRLAPDDVVQLALIGATPHERAMILLARMACLRLTELTTLHSRHRQHDLLRILGKGEKERLVYANEDLMSALLTLERVQGPGFYFPGKYGAHMHPQSVNKIITRLTGCNPHSLRHAGATAAYRATRDLRAVQAMLGHASMATTQRYLHLDEDALRAAAAATSFPERPRATTNDPDPDRYRTVLRITRHQPSSQTGHG